MNKFITVYELFGLIKDGKAPKKIKYEYSVYELTSERNDYYCKQEKRWFTNEINSLGVLNDKLEILEEYKPIIEKIDTTEENILFTMECYTGIPEKAQDWNFNILKDKLNEVIDYINKKENK